MSLSAPSIISYVPAATLLEEVERLYLRSRYLRALEVAGGEGALRAWRGPDGRVLASRLAYRLGSPRLARALVIRAVREHPAHPKVRYFWLHGDHARKGAASVLLEMEAQGDLPESAGLDLRASWCSLMGSLCARLHDFASAQAHFGRAQAMHPGNTWTEAERVFAFELADRHDEALALACRLHADHPDYRPAILARARMLAVVGREVESAEFLRECADRLESGELWATLGGALRGRDDASAREAYEKAAACYPLATQGDREAWLGTIRSDLACACGDRAAAIAFLDAVPERRLGSFHRGVRERMATASADARRILLDVPFVRQHHMTCVPATLAMLAAYWGRPAEHPAIAEEICWNGTSHLAARGWAQANGWICREFTATPDVAAQLVARGVPFALTTASTTGGHMMAVAGHDAIRGTLLLRDPTNPGHGEMREEQLTGEYAPWGPHGMLILPPEKAELLRGCDLPDAEAWDTLHRLLAALDRHDRPAADAEARILADAPRCIGFEARRVLADYDGSALARRDAAQALADPWPKSSIAAARAWHAAAPILPPVERLPRLEVLIAALRSDKKWDVSLEEAFVAELAVDGRRREECRRALRRLARWDDSATALSLMADRRWEKGERSEALRLYRLAMCRDRRNERHVATFLERSRALHREEDALAVLSARAEEFGGRDAEPVISASTAFFALDRMEEGFGLLSRWMERRPDDARLALHACGEFARFGRFDEAREFLLRAKAFAHPRAWKRAEAALFEASGDLWAARAAWREVHSASPLDMRVLETLLRLLDPAETAPFLEGRMAEHPCFVPLHEIAYRWISLKDTGSRLAALDAILRLVPAHGWAWREKALLLMEEGRGDEARAALGMARACEPESAFNDHIAAGFSRKDGDIPAAMKSLRSAVEKWPDDAWAMAEATQIGDAAAAAEFLRQAAGIFRDSILRGGGLLSWQQAASAARGGQRILGPAETLGLLAEARAARPDLWESFCAEARELLAQRKVGEADVLLRQGVERFPMVAPLQMLRAEVASARGDRAAQESVLREVLRFSPGHAEASHGLADFLELVGRRPEAEPVLRRALSREPQNVHLGHHLAHVLWSLRRRDEAIGALERALRFAPDFTRGWDDMALWCAASGSRDRMLGAVRGLGARFPRSSDAWQVFARYSSDEFPARLGAARKAVELAPGRVDAHECLVAVLAGMHRDRDAIEACRPDAFAGAPPYALRVREAYLLGRVGDAAAAESAFKKLEEEKPMLRAWGDFGRYCDEIEAGRIPVSARTSWSENHTIFTWWGKHASIQASRAEDRSMRRADESLAAVEYAVAAHLNPGYAYPVRQAVSICLERGKQGAERAAEILDPLAAGLPPKIALELLLRVAAALGDRERLRRLTIAAATVPDMPWDSVFKECASGGLLCEGLCSAVADGKATDWASEILGKRLASLGSPGEALRRLEALPANRSSDLALSFALEGKLSKKDVLRFIKRNAKRLGDVSRDPVLWGGAIYALHRAGEYRRCVELGMDWEKRGKRFWILRNLAGAWRAEGRMDEAVRLSRTVLEIPQAGAVWKEASFLAWHAADCGETEEARKMLALVKWEEMDPDGRFFANMAKASLEAETGDGTAAFRSLKAARAGSEGWVFRNAVHSRGYARMYRRIAAQNGSRIEKARGAWFSLRANRAVQGSAFLWRFVMARAWLRYPVLLMAGFVGVVLLALLILPFADTRHSLGPRGSSSSSSSPAGPAVASIVVFACVFWAIVSQKRVKH